ncbi:hypothetical protein [Metabacillus malikii]|uniref:Uncharacterized protein n=1 Tax=Metabacillus malikii TaxID=1504265 RepID=A0ABT9ZB06_9BACI|nr:hypothetical protein [Metabacillus malikii]MDQ0229099.1 hypothetical protein [Metabacillus malikii]
MKGSEYWLDVNITKADFNRLIKKLLPQKRVLYAYIPESYNDFLTEMSTKFVTIKKIIDDKYTYPKCVYTLGYIEDDELEFAFEFFERASIIRFVIATETICVNGVEEDLEKFYDFFMGENTPHITIGPDQQYVTYYS